MKSVIRRTIVRGVLAALLGLVVVPQVFASPPHPRHHAHPPRVSVVAGPFWSPFWFPPPWHYPPPVIVVPPPAPPPVYIEQTRPPVVVPAYWYFCPSSKAYYPTVPSCPEAWVAVPANSDY